jgi:8-oxo-dGTP pyrophosphatase MutT (NUDIX family)
MKKKKLREHASAGPSTDEKRRQYGALPYRMAGDGHLEVMLVTSRETRRWVVPKGWPIKNLKPHSSAEREAFEEAGLLGRVGKRPVGSYHYGKRLRAGTTVTCEVELFPLEVRKQAKTWPEKDQREQRWFGLDEAAAAVAEPELGDLFRRLGDLIQPAAPDPSAPDPSAPDPSAPDPSATTIRP